MSSYVVAQRPPLGLISFRTHALKGLLGLIAFLVAGNLAIVGATQVMRRIAPATVEAPQGIHNFRVVDDAELWRGGAPSRTGYRSLAAAGVTTIVDLRAEATRVDRSYLASLGLDLVPIPMRDGQAPTPAQVQLFLDTVAEKPGLVYVHCAAGVGRTGTMVASYLVKALGQTPFDALRHNLSVGPPSLEQLSFAAELRGEVERPNPLVTVASRILDGPRRIMVNVRSW